MPLGFINSGPMMVGSSSVSESDTIYFDKIRGDTLANGADGTPSKPLNTESEVITQLDSKKFFKVSIALGSDFNVPSSISNIAFFGSSLLHCGINLNDYSFSSCSFHYLYISGSNSSTELSTAYNCMISLEDNAGWIFKECLINYLVTAADSYCINCSFINTNISWVPSGGSAMLNGMGTAIIASSPQQCTIELSGGIEVGTTSENVYIYSQTTLVKSVEASSTMQMQDSSEYTTYSLEYAFVSNIFPLINLAGVTIKFDLKTEFGGGATAYGKIYRNGVPIGTERTDATGNYQTFSEDFINIKFGDNIAIYAYTTDANQAAYIENIQLCYDYV
jgi:hypothetical protein